MADVELPAHPSPSDLAEATIDLDEGRAHLHKLVAAGSDASSARELERTLELTVPLLHAAYSLAVTNERARVAGWLTGLGERAKANGSPVRGQVLAALGTELNESLGQK